MGPIVVRALLRPLPVNACQVLACGSVDAGRLRELRQELLIRRARVAPHDASQRRVRFQRGRINPNRLAFDQALVGEPLQDPREDGFVRFEIDQAPGPRNRRMIRRRLGQHQPEKLAERKGIRGAPRDGALGVQAFEVADQQQAKVAPGRQTRPADLVGVESLAERLDVVIEARVVEDMIQSCVERVRGGPRQIVCRDPHRRLLRPPSSFAHRHRRQCSRRDRSCRSLIHCSPRVRVFLLLVIAGRVEGIAPTNALTSTSNQNCRAFAWRPSLAANGDPVSVDGTTCDVSVPSSVAGPASRLDASKTYGMSVFAKTGPHEIERARRDTLDTGVVAHGAPPFNDGPERRVRRTVRLTTREPTVAERADASGIEDRHCREGGRADEGLRTGDYANRETALTFPIVRAIKK
jgi:hypothetical protein